VSGRHPALLYDVLHALVVRELHVRYKSSVLGILWAVLSPLGTVAILHLLFTRIVPLGIPHYASFVYAGLLPWTWFQSALFTSAGTLLDHRDLVRMPFFPRPLLPAAVTASNFLLYLLAFPVLLALVAMEGVWPGETLLLLPAVWLVQAVFTMALATLVAALGALVRDVQHLLGVVLVLWFYLTPIFYGIDRVQSSEARWLLLNPMAILVQAHRAIALEGRSPDWGALGACALVSGGLLAAALAVFRALEHLVIEEV